ncbi:tRNA (5-methylaminomethyl-2-thiouridine)(34)-methyltransferase MnmD [Gymnodinialimonas hymeniacidonis]|uniref:tRNA (5-methylaminomethyl-2-thiouridine)(34)-methyltransferase MnmD n=1 Tax=Gymnodinialimonas hymeniacidonis TaxID=3126508 RepID=UPI0034C623A8
MDQDQQKIEWRGAVPVSTRFDDPYFSLDDGLAETRYVFLEGNDLPGRFTDGFHVAELGFGTGLNFLATLQSWRAAGMAGVLHFTSFEAFPMPMGDLTHALAAFDELPTEVLTSAIGPDLPPQIEGPDFTLSIIQGDARETLPAWDGKADAWFLDGFAPAKNPDMWSAELMAEVGRRTAPGGTFATYTAVGYVRRALDAAGFDLERIPGFGRKRHMTKGRLR